VLLVDGGLGGLIPTLEAALAACRSQDELLLIGRGLDEDATELAAWAAAAQAEPRVLFVPAEEGFCAPEDSYRRALLEAQGEHVVFLQAGRLLSSSCLDLLVGALEESPRLVAVGPLAEDVPGRQDLKSAGHSLVEDDHAAGPEFAARLAAEEASPFEVEGLAPDCLVVRIGPLRKLVAQHPSAFFASEGYRLPQLLRAAGSRLAVVPRAFVGRATVEHVGGAIAARTAAQRRANYLWEEVRLRLGHDPDPRLWEGNAIAPQTGLASIIVLVWDNLEVTRPCLASLFEQTLRPFELILVDNGSAPPTAGFLDQMAEHYECVQVVRNAENQGYSFGCNQGLAAAQGDYIVLLNNDVVVTPSWLSDQIALFTGHPQIGLVGPRTNESAGPQRVPAEQVGYSGLEGLPLFVQKWRRRQSLNFTFTDPLTGLCMVLQRDLILRIGGLDTSFWLGNLEDNDFCIRIARAGYQMALAHDVFVHHEGSSTFSAQNIDYTALLARNWEFFCTKWGFEQPLGSGFPTQKLVEGRPFSAAFDYIPPESREVFRPGLEPIEIVGAPARMVLMIPEFEGEEWKAPFADFVSTFGADSGLTLLLRVDPPGPRQAERATQAVAAEFAALGLSEADTPDIILDTTVLNPSDRGRLYCSAEALLCCGGSRAKLHAREALACSLPLLSDLGPEGLRLRLDAMGEAKAAEEIVRAGSANSRPSSANEESGGARPPLSGPRPGVSIVIVTYNSSETIANCLKSLKMYSRDDDQIIVVDNVSGDSTRTILRNCRNNDIKDMTLILADANLGFSRGVNLGLQQARCPLVLMLNPDTVITGASLDAMAAHLMADSRVGAVGPTSDYAAGMQNVGQYYSGGPIGAEELADHLSSTSEGPLETKLLIGFCLMMWTETLEELGGLDPELFLGNDDLDVSLRLAAQDQKLLIATDAFVHHQGQVSFATEPKQRTSYLVNQSTNLLYEKLYAERDGEVPSGSELWDVTWFTPHRGRLSVVLVVGDDPSATASCVSSLLAGTHRDLELVFVACSEAAAVSAQALVGPQDGVAHLRAPEGASAGEALNYGLEAATGDHVLLTSDDVLYPRGTVAKLLALLSTQANWGLVGPRCVFSSGAQGLPHTDPAALSDVENFAWQWHESEAGASKSVAVLGDFCALGMRSVLLKLGGVDSDFSPGSFRGMDLSMRMTQAGYALGLAQDVVVHRLRPDRDVPDEDAGEMVRFATKWGLGESAAQSAVDPKESATTERPDMDIGTRGPLTTRHAPADDDPFHPGAPPLGIRHSSSHLLLCIPDWERPAWKELLTSFIAAFPPGEGVGLLVRVEPPDKKQADFAVSALQGALGALGVTEERMPEIVLEVTPLAEELRPGLYTAARAFLSDGGRGDLVHRHEATACGLAVLDLPSPDVLRGLFSSP